MTVSFNIRTRLEDGKIVNHAEPGDGVPIGECVACGIEQDGEAAALTVVVRRNGYDYVAAFCADCVGRAGSNQLENLAGKIVSVLSKKKGP
jgi:Zn ribbon nucleic-acid-binding protein